MTKKIYNKLDHREVHPDEKKINRTYKLSQELIDAMEEAIDEPIGPLIEKLMRRYLLMPPLKKK